MNKYVRYGLTGLVVLIAVVAVMFKYRAYIGNPWTRDGQVRAQVLQITPRVSAPIVNLAIQDNQFVKAGDLLFELDPRTFEADLAQSRANLELTRYEFAAMTPQIAAAEAGVLSAAASVAQAQASIAQADATIQKNKAEYERQQELLPQEGHVDEIGPERPGQLRSLGRADEGSPGRSESGQGVAGPGGGIPRRSPCEPRHSRRCQRARVYSGSSRSSVSYER